MSSDTDTQLTVANQVLEIDGATLVYRRFGNTQTSAPPLLSLQHFRGNLDFWDEIRETPMAHCPVLAELEEGQAIHELGGNRHGRHR